MVTEQRFAGLASAPAALAEAFVHDLAPEKHVRVPFNPRDRWLSAARESCRTLSDGIAASMRAGAQIGVLGGECTLVAGSLSGALSVEPDLTLVYVDAHGDFNTLATTQSHYVSGMCLAHVCGHSVAPLLWPGARKIAEDHVALVGGRALETGERQNLERSRVAHIAFDAENRDPSRIVAFARRKKVWLHVDVDIVDPPGDDGRRLPRRGRRDVARARRPHHPADQRRGRSRLRDLRLRPEAGRAAQATRRDQRSLRVSRATRYRGLKDAVGTWASRRRRCSRR